MNICSRCGSAVSDANAQLDPQGNLLCRACSGAWRHSSVRAPSKPAAPATSAESSAAPSAATSASASSSAGVSQRRGSSSGPWRLIGMVGSTAAAFLLVISIALVLGRSSLKKENSDLAGRSAGLAKDLSTARAETDEIRKDRDRCNARIAQLERETRTLRERQAKLQTELDEARKAAAPAPPTAGTTGTRPTSGTTGARPGNGGTTGPVSTPVTDRPAPPAGTTSSGTRPDQPAAEGPQLFAWKTSATLYHVAGCRLCAGREVIPITRAEALKRKLKPCSKCKPPTQ